MFAYMPLTVNDLRDCNKFKQMKHVETLFRKLRFEKQPIARYGHFKIDMRKQIFLILTLFLWTLKIYSQIESLPQKIIYDTISPSNIEYSKRHIINRIDSTWICFDEGFDNIRLDIYLNDVLYHSQTYSTNGLLGYASYVTIPKYSIEERVIIKHNYKIIANFIVDKMIPIIHFSIWDGTREIIFTNKKKEYL
jgi:hypothetical protein